ncbi:MAG: antibiotic biosynthesis monooxygenase [Planctomyces sp.]|nr:antibiotic biosynthesis monooxygenase [Planctomyces sp.]
MVYVNVVLTVKSDADVPRVRELLSEQARLSRAEPGCLRFEVYHSENDPRTFLLVERWESDAALDVHRTAHAYTTVYHPQVLPLVERTPHRSQLVSG